MLVRVHAAAVTPTELVWVPTWTTPRGEPRRFPIILGHEFSGEVAAVGDGVTDVAVGNPVYGLNDWFGDGALAEYCVARAAEVAPKPRSVDHLAAAVTPISALTAWQGLLGRARLAAGWLGHITVDTCGTAVPHLPSRMIDFKGLARG